MEKTDGRSQAQHRPPRRTKNRLRPRASPPPPRLRKLRPVGHPPLLHGTRILRHPPPRHLPRPRLLVPPRPIPLRLGRPTSIRPNDRLLETFSSPPQRTHRLECIEMPVLHRFMNALSGGLRFFSHRQPPEIPSHRIHLLPGGMELLDLATRSRLFQFHCPGVKEIIAFKLDAFG